MVSSVSSPAVLVEMNQDWEQQLADWEDIFAGWTVAPNVLDSLFNNWSRFIKLTRGIAANPDYGQTQFQQRAENFLKNLTLQLGIKTCHLSKLENLVSFKALFYQFLQGGANPFLEKHTNREFLNWFKELEKNLDAQVHKFFILRHLTTWQELGHPNPIIALLSQLKTEKLRSFVENTLKSAKSDSKGEDVISHLPTLTKEISRKMRFEKKCEAIAQSLRELQLPNADDSKLQTLAGSILIQHHPFGFIAITDDFVAFTKAYLVNLDLKYHEFKREHEDRKATNALGLYSRILEQLDNYRKAHVTIKYGVTDDEVMAAQVQATKAIESIKRDMLDNPQYYEDDITRHYCLIIQQLVIDTLQKERIRLNEKHSTEKVIAIDTCLKRVNNQLHSYKRDFIFANFNSLDSKKPAVVEHVIWQENTAKAIKQILNEDLVANETINKHSWGRDIVRQVFKKLDELLHLSELGLIKTKARRAAENVSGKLDKIAKKFHADIEENKEKLPIAAPSA